MKENVVRGRRALVRVDYNVPVASGRVADAARIEASHATLRLLLDRGARPVLLSHLGRPKGAPDPRYSLAPVAQELEKGMGVRVCFTGPADSAEAVEMSRSLREGEILLLENTRFLPGETVNDDDLARRFARLGDFFVNDAFGSLHRAHASTVGVARYVHPAVAGLLVESELRALKTLREEPERPFVAVFGGAKISDKIDLLRGFLGRCDELLIGGAMANTLLRAQGFPMGSSLVEPNALPMARELLSEGGSRLALPSDLVVEASGSDAPEIRTVAVREVDADLTALDIGETTRQRFGDRIRQARTVFWNGPMGQFERPPFAEGTLALARAAAEAAEAGAFVVVGGGDSARAVRQAGIAQRISYVSTGGGASLQFLANGTLPGLEALDDESATGVAGNHTSEGRSR